MKSRMAVVLSLLLAAPGTAVAQGSPDAVAADPRHHHVLFENDHVRVFRALASPGARSPMHTHPPFVFIGMGTARLQLATPAATGVIFDVHPEQVLWMENAEHSWELVAGQAHVVGVEVKAARQGTIPPAMTLPTTDATAADPASHRVILENDYVRVIEVLAGAGTRSPMHTHSRGIALVSLGRSRVSITGTDGKSQLLDLHPGEAFWLDPVSHSWEIASGQHRLIAVEIKSAAGGR